MINVKDRIEQLEKNKKKEQQDPKYNVTFTYNNQKHPPEQHHPETNKNTAPKYNIEENKISVSGVKNQWEEIAKKKKQQKEKQPKYTLPKFYQFKKGVKIADLSQSVAKVFENHFKQNEEIKHEDLVQFLSEDQLKKIIESGLLIERDTTAEDAAGIITNEVVINNFGQKDVNFVVDVVNNLNPPPPPPNKNILAEIITDLSDSKQKKKQQQIHIDNIINEVPIQKPKIKQQPQDIILIPQKGDIQYNLKLYSAMKKLIGDEQDDQPLVQQNAETGQKRQIRMMPVLVIQAFSRLLGLIVPQTIKNLDQNQIVTIKKAPKQ